MKSWTIYGERLFKCHHHLGQSLWPANRKQLFMKSWTIYGERLFKTSPPGPIGMASQSKAIVHENFDNIW
jgi:hypothetical protein